MTALVPLEDDFLALSSRVAALESLTAAMQYGSNGPSMQPYVMAEEFGVSPDNADNRAQLQAAVDAAWDRQLCTVKVPAKRFLISGPIDVSGVSLEGPGSFSSCALVLTQSGQDMVTINGHRGGLHVPGGALRNINLYIPQGVNGRIAIAIGQSAYPNAQPDLFHIEGVRITAGSIPGFSGAYGTFERAINANGTWRTSPPGIRGGYIRDVEFFNCRGPALVFFGVTNLRMSSVRGFTGGGVTAYTGAWFGGNATVKCSDVQVSDCRWDGPINVTNCVDSGFEGRFYGGVQHDPQTAPNCVFSTD